MIDLSGRGHRALQTTAAGALFDGDGGRDAENRIDIGTCRRLNELPGIGVDGFQIASLAFTKHDVERERRLARARYAGDHVELLAWQYHVDVLEIVLTRPMNAQRRLCGL